MLFYHILLTYLDDPERKHPIRDAFWHYFLCMALTLLTGAALVAAFFLFFFLLAVIVNW